MFAGLSDIIFAAQALLTDLQQFVMPVDVKFRQLFQPGDNAFGEFGFRLPAEFPDFQRIGDADKAGENHDDCQRVAEAFQICAAKF